MPPIRIPLPNFIIGLTSLNNVLFIKIELKPVIPETAIVFGDKLILLIEFAFIKISLVNKLNQITKDMPKYYLSFCLVKLKNNIILFLVIERFLPVPCRFKMPHNVFGLGEGGDFHHKC
jgi:hypothetical protein